MYQAYGLVRSLLTPIPQYPSLKFILPPSFPPPSSSCGTYPSPSTSTISSHSLTPLPPPLVSVLSSVTPPCSSSSSTTVAGSSPLSPMAPWLWSSVLEYRGHYHSVSTLFLDHGEDSAILRDIISVETHVSRSYYTTTVFMPRSNFDFQLLPTKLFYTRWFHGLASAL